MPNRKIAQLPQKKLPLNKPGELQFLFPNDRLSHEQSPPLIGFASHATCEASDNVLGFPLKIASYPQCFH